MYQPIGLGRAPVDEIATPRPPTNKTTATIPTMKPPAIARRTPQVATMPIVVKPVVKAATQAGAVKTTSLRPPDNRPGWMFAGGRWTRPITDYKVAPFTVVKSLTPTLKQIVPLTKTQAGMTSLMKAVETARTLTKTVSKPVTVSAPGSTKTVAPLVRNFFAKPTDRPTNSAKPEVQIVTAATGKPAVEIKNPPETVIDTRPPTATITTATPGSKPFLEFEKPLIQIQPKPPEVTDQPAQAGISEGAKTWIKYGLIAAGAFILWNAFSAPKRSARLRRA